MVDWMDGFVVVVARDAEMGSLAPPRARNAPWARE
jgi:hypothetical protein